MTKGELLHALERVDDKTNIEVGVVEGEGGEMRRIHILPFSVACNTDRVQVYFMCTLDRANG